MLNTQLQFWTYQVMFLKITLNYEASVCHKHMMSGLMMVTVKYRFFVWPPKTKAARAPPSLLPPKALTFPGLCLRSKGCASIRACPALCTVTVSWSMTGSAFLSLSTWCQVWPAGKVPVAYRGRPHTHWASCKNIFLLLS